MKEKAKTIKKGNGIVNWILIILGSLWTIWFLLPFLTKRVLNIGNVTGILLGILVVLLGLFTPQVASLLVAGWKIKGLRILFGIIGTGLAVILGLAIYTASLMVYGSTRSPKENATVVVLGCKVYGDKPSLMLTERLDAAYDYLEKYSDTKCIVSGGKGDDEDLPEGQVMKTYLVKRGIDESRIYVEDQSVSTRENLKFSYAIIERENLNRNLAIATNDFHEYRAYRVAKALGLESGAISGRTAWWLLPTFAVREMYGILYEFVY